MAVAKRNSYIGVWDAACWRDSVSSRVSCVQSSKCLLLTLSLCFAIRCALCSGYALALFPCASISSAEPCRG
jgi:hypothetical protein